MVSDCQVVPVRLSASVPPIARQRPGPGHDTEVGFPWIEGEGDMPVQVRPFQAPASTQSQAGVSVWNWPTAVQLLTRAQETLSMPELIPCEVPPMFRQALPFQARPALRNPTPELVPLPPTATQLKELRQDTPASPQNGTQPVSGVARARQR